MKTDLFQYLFSVPLADPQVGKSVVGPKTFALVQELFGKILLQLVGHLPGGAMVRLMVTSSKKTQAPCWAPRVAAARAPVPADGQTHMQVWGISAGGHGSFPGPGATGFRLHAHVAGGMRLDFKCGCTPPSVLLQLLLCPWTWGIFFWWDPTFSCGQLFSS